MKDCKIVVAGIGPGSEQDVTPAVIQALQTSDIVVGYKPYFRFVRPWIPNHAQCVDTGMKRERARAEQAFAWAEQGRRVCVISSGDAGIYGMASLIYEMKRKRNSPVEIEVLPGISAFQKAASLLGAPVGHDFCVLSLSDLMTPWAVIEKRIRAAASADFVTAVYNPRSRERYWQLDRLREIFLEERAAGTPVGIVRQAGREEEQVMVTTLEHFDPDVADMFTIILIGNSQSYLWNGGFITPRGYYQEETTEKTPVGRRIMAESFRIIGTHWHAQHLPLGHRWALLHAIHTTADFDMERLLYVDDGAVETLFGKFQEGRIKTIITDVNMVAAGIRRGALERLGAEVKCYLNDPRTTAWAAEQQITRTQAGIRLAVQEHPEALYVFGNAPTALMELCDLMRSGKASPCGIIAAPVGFVHVCESKYMVKTFVKVPKLIIEGRKGGSTLAATLVNAILTFDDAGEAGPGRDV